MAPKMAQKLMLLNRPHQQQVTPAQNGAGLHHGAQQAQTVAPGAMVAAAAAGPPQVSLSLLIEFIVQRTYHDLTVLAELLPRKTDTERKIEIFNFASRTRMLFVRLLALVKWAGSASKVDKCVSIVNFCDRSAQGLLSIENSQSSQIADSK